MGDGEGEDMTFTGEISLLRSSCYYYVEDPYGCSGYAHDLLVGHCQDHGRDSKAYEVFSWGYECNGADLLAVALLAVSLDDKWPPHSSWWDHRQREAILRHYKAFASEFVANFGNKWSMESEDIIDWVAKKEKESQHAVKT